MIFSVKRHVERRQELQFNHNHLSVSNHMHHPDFKMDRNTFQLDIYVHSLLKRNWCSDESNCYEYDNGLNA